MKILKRFFKREHSNDFITIVSGIPRSGTSMMMSMLEAGGIRTVTDNIRKPDENNPKGYYEFERVKEIKRDNSWLEECCGKAVKMISELLFYLPDNREYRIIFMQRNMNEILASQRAMLSRLGKKGANLDDTEMSDSFGKHIMRVDKWLSEQNHDVLKIGYGDVIRSPKENAAKVNRFLNHRLDISKMVEVVDQTLHRQRDIKGRI